MKEVLRLVSKNVLNKYDHHSSLSRTCEALAEKEVHLLHAYGEHDLVDSACGSEGEVRERNTVRNEGGRAADRKKLFN